MMQSNLTDPSELWQKLGDCGRNGIELNHMLASHTSFRIGGPTAKLLSVNRSEKLVTALNLLYHYNIPFLLLGGGSNVLVSDAGISSLVILNQCRQIDWSHSEASPFCVTAESGASLAGLARAAIKRNLAGLAWAVSVPGAVGGAVVGNAGAHGKSIADTLQQARLWSQGTVRDSSAAALQLQYRRSRIKPLVAKPGFGPVVLNATLQLSPDSSGDEKARAEQYIDHRRRTQPLDKSAGSIFKNPPSDFAGRLIEAAEMKGIAVGGASVSEQHANFIINQGDATANDVVNLMNLIRAKVYDRFGVVLEPEIQLVGDWQSQARLEPLPT